MNDSELDSVISAWIEQGPVFAPASVGDAARLEAGSLMQRRPWNPVRLLSLGPAPLVGAAVLVVLAISLIPVLAPGYGGQPTSPGAVPSVDGSAAPTPRQDVEAWSDIGLVGLPPVGAVPSDPTVVRLIDSWPVDGGGVPFRGAARLYADGRLIWYRFVDGLSRSSGYVERRLSPSGIELVLTLEGLTRKDPHDLQTSLPASAWIDPSPRPYIPSEFGICMVGEVAQPADLLPSVAAAILDGKSLVDPDDPASCVRVTVDEARAFARVLFAAGVPSDDSFALEYTIGPAARPTRQVHVILEPILPDGSTGCSLCG